MMTVKNCNQGREETVSVTEKITEKVKDTKNSNEEEFDFKCHQCYYMCRKKVTVSKHTNTKHGVNI